MSKEEILRAVTAFYLESPDFNGIPVRTLIAQCQLDAATLKVFLISLLHQDKVSLEFGDIYPNPHIKAFASYTSEQQVEKLQEIQLAEVNPCVYPSPAHLKTLVDPNDYQGKPFTLRLALGEPQLSYVSFDLRVLEFYRNDPRYYYTCDDISGEIGIADEYYNSDTIGVSDRILLQSFGFSYNTELHRAGCSDWRWWINRPALCKPTSGRFW